MKNQSSSHRAFWVISLLCLLLNSVSALAELKTIDEAINIAGKQRTLIQQMLKNYNLISSKVRVRKAQQELGQAITLFDTQLLDLKKFAINAATQQQVSHLNEVWQKAKMMYAIKANQSQLSQLHNTSDELLNACQSLMAILLKGSANPKVGLFNTVHSEQMLIERIVALYALKSAGVLAPYQTGYNKAVSEFNQNWDILNAQSNNSIKTRAQLTQVKQHFKRFTATVASHSNGDYSLAIVAAAAEKISLELAEIKGAYQ